MLFLVSWVAQLIAQWQVFTPETPLEVQDRVGTTARTGVTMSGTG